jgi:hypothetical protein
MPSTIAYLTSMWLPNAPGEADAVDAIDARRSIRRRTPA